MAGWITLAKVIAPHVSTIVSAALPAFTVRKGDVPEPASGLVQQQIDELQRAVATNDAHIRELAAQLGRSAEALDRQAAAAARRLRLALGMAGGALVAALGALIVALQG